MITFSHKGDFKKTFNFLEKAQKLTMPDLHFYGERGVAALRLATPRDTGKTANSWHYEVVRTENGFALRFCNTNVVDGWANVAVLIQYGHSTKSGVYVEGIDYINPAIKPIFEEIARDLWKEVKVDG